MVSKAYIKCFYTGEVLEDLGRVTYDSSPWSLRVIFERFAPEADAWCIKGYLAEIIIIDEE